MYWLKWLSRQPRGEEPGTPTTKPQVERDDECINTEDGPGMDIEKSISRKIMRSRRLSLTVKRAEGLYARCVSTDTHQTIIHETPLRISTIFSLEDTETVKDGHTSEEQGRHCSKILQTIAVDRTE